MKKIISIFTLLFFSLSSKCEENIKIKNAIKSIQYHETGSGNPLSILRTVEVEVEYWIADSSKAVDKNVEFIILNKSDAGKSDPEISISAPFVIKKENFTRDHKTIKFSVPVTIKAMSPFFPEVFTIGLKDLNEATGGFVDVTIGEKQESLPTPSTATTAQETNTESYSETFSYNDLNYELKVFRNTNDYFQMELLDFNGKSFVSKINMNENFEYENFKSILIQLMNLMLTSSDSASTSHETIDTNTLHKKAYKTISKSTQKPEALNTKDANKVNVTVAFEHYISKMYNTFIEKIKRTNDPVVKELKSRLEKADEELDEKYKYAGVFKVKRNHVSTYQQKQKQRKVENQIGDANLYFNDSTIVSVKKTGDSLAITKKLYDKNSNYIKDTVFKINRISNENNYNKTKGIFYLDSAYVSINNNTIDKLSIFGKYSIDSIQQKEIQYTSPIRNLNRSIGMRGLNIKDYYFDINSGTKNIFSIKLNDLFGFTHYKDNYSYVVKDQSFVLDTIKNSGFLLRKRALYDYLSVVTFVDFLGVSNESNNNFIQIEGRARFPLELSSLSNKTFSGITLFPNFETYLSASFVNNNNVGGRKANIFRDTTNGQNTLFYDHFDLFRSYNLKSGINLSLFCVQKKEIHSRIYLNYDVKMYRTTFNYTNLKPGADSIVQSNLYSLTHGPSILIEYKPEFNIGAELRFSADLHLTPFNNGSGVLDYKAGKGPIYKDSETNPYKFDAIKGYQKTIWGIELSAYSFLSPEKSKNDGIYFRFAMYTDNAFKQLSPYLMVGYATSLKGLIKGKSGKAAIDSGHDN